MPLDSATLKAPERPPTSGVCSPRCPIKAPGSRVTVRAQNGSGLASSFADDVIVFRPSTSAWTPRQNSLPICMAAQKKLLSTKFDDVMQAQRIVPPLQLARQRRVEHRLRTNVAPPPIHDGDPCQDSAETGSSADLHNHEASFLRPLAALVQLHRMVCDAHSHELLLQSERQQVGSASCLSSSKEGVMTSDLMQLNHLLGNVMQAVLLIRSGKSHHCFSRDYDEMGPSSHTPLTENMLEWQSIVGEGSKLGVHVRCGDVTLPLMVAIHSSQRLSECIRPKLLFGVLQRITAILLDALGATSAPTSAISKALQGLSRAIAISAQDAAVVVDAPAHGSFAEYSQRGVTDTCAAVTALTDWINEFESARELIEKMRQKQTGCAHELPVERDTHSLPGCMSRSDARTASAGYDAIRAPTQAGRGGFQRLRIPRTPASQGTQRQVPQSTTSATATPTACLHRLLSALRQHRALTSDFINTYSRSVLTQEDPDFIGDVLVHSNPCTRIRSALQAYLVETLRALRIQRLLLQESVRSARKQHTATPAVACFKIPFPTPVLRAVLELLQLGRPVPSLAASGAATDVSGNAVAVLDVVFAEFVRDGCVSARKISARDESCVLQWLRLQRRMWHPDVIQNLSSYARRRSVLESGSSEDPRASQSGCPDDSRLEELDETTNAFLDDVAKRSTECVQLCTRVQEDFGRLSGSH